MWTDGRRTKTAPKTSLEQSAVTTSRVFTGHVLQRTGTIFEHKSQKTAPPTGGHVFSPIWTIFERVPDINKSNVLINHFFQRTGTIFELNSHWTKNVTSSVFTCFNYKHIEKTAPPAMYINKTNVLTKFHDDRTRNVASRVFTRKTAPPTGGHVFQRTGTTFEINQYIIKTNIVTKFHEYWT
ncbi:hypothetical protein DPMN_143685 [Dreissena polymorpha]|uniref:Uncharacterized protein n=1 Tax=Dreissena polymorpha TaxID=45954 RepID=A0A9D4JNG0_DREPO|nr:hypothetical protein DPMN_143685 [Dreissena polymorpha]